MRHYDVILAGGGAAGLSLAHHLAQHPRFADARLLIIDEVVKDRNDHTWCSWLRDPEPFDEIAYRVWNRLAFIAPGFEQTFDLAPYRYRMVRAIDLYRHVREWLAPKAMSRPRYTSTRSPALATGSSTAATAHRTIGPQTAATTI
jgi:lycopene beta-cyclase